MQLEEAQQDLQISEKKSEDLWEKYEQATPSEKDKALAAYTAEKTKASNLQKTISYTRWDLQELEIKMKGC